MESPEHAVEQHYGSADICARILASLRVAGRDLERLERRDRTPFDEFHGGGIASTRDLAAFAGMRADMHVLDLGCDISGPARTLAAEFGCRVSGIDLTAEFVRAADMLTSRIGMQDVCDLEPQGWLTRDAQNSYLAGDGLEAGPMDELLGSSITYRIAVGPQGLHAATPAARPRWRLACGPVPRRTVHRRTRGRGRFGRRNAGLRAFAGHRPPTNVTKGCCWTKSLFILLIRR